MFWLKSDQGVRYVFEGAVCRHYVDSHSVLETVSRKLDRMIDDITLFFVASVG